MVALVEEATAESAQAKGTPVHHPAPGQRLP